MKQKSWLEAGRVLAFFTALSILMTWPAAGRLTTHLMGDTIDLWLAQWDNWWLLTAIEQGLDPWHTPYLFHPQELNMAYHSFSWVNMLGWLPLQALLGPIGAYNITLMLTFVLAGLGMYYWVKELTLSRPAALVSGIIYVYAPYHIWESLGHPNLATIQWLPLGLLFLHRTINQKGKWDGWVAGLLLGLSGLAGAHMLVFTGLMAGLFLLASIRTIWSREFLKPLTSTAVLAVLVTLPITFPVIRDLAQGGAMGEMLLDESAAVYTEFKAFFHTGTLQVIGRWLKPLQGTSRFSAYLGFVPLLLMLVAAVGVRWKALFWVGTFALWTWLAMGQQLSPPGLMGIIREPSRFNILVGFSLAVAAGIGLAFLLKRVSNPGKRWGLAAAVGIVVLLEYASIPFPTIKPTSSSYFTTSTDTSAILALPTGRQNAKFAMYDQTIHQRPLVEGVAARTPMEAYDFLASIPMLQLAGDQQLQYGPAPNIEAVSEALQALHEQNIGAIVFYKQTIWPNLLAEWQEFLTIEPEYEDEHILVYCTRPQFGEDYQLTQSLPNGFGIIKSELSATEITQGEPVWLDLRWGAKTAVDSSFEAELYLSDENKQRVHQQSWPPPMGLVSIARHPIQLSPFFPAGTYSLTIRLSGEDTAGELHLPETLQVSARDRTLHAPRLEIASGAVFGEIINLRSYQLDKDGAGVHLQWQALDRPPADFKLFVHLLGQDDQIVAQWDGMPRDWSYPTSWWEAGEIVADHIRLEASMGKTWRVGWYHPATGERLVTSLGDEFLLLPAEP